MHSFSRMIRSRLLLAGLCASLAVSFMLAQTSVRSVKVLGSKDAVEIEVQASDRIVPQTLVLTGPDRLVIDFANAVPSSELRSQSVDRGQVKSLRIGLFQSKPPITRVVVDLKSAQSYQVFPYGRTVMIKVMGGGADVSAGAGNYPSQPATRPSLVTANYTTSAEPISVAPCRGAAARRYLSQRIVGDQGQQGDAVGGAVRGAAADWRRGFDCRWSRAGKSSGGHCSRARTGSSGTTAEWFQI